LGAGALHRCLKPSPTSPKRSGIQALEEGKRRAALEERDSARVTELDRIAVTTVRRTTTCRGRKPTPRRSSRTATKTKRINHKRQVRKRVAVKIANQQNDGSAWHVTTSVSKDRSEFWAKAARLNLPIVSTGEIQSRTKTCMFN